MQATIIPAASSSIVSLYNCYCRVCLEMCFFPPSYWWGSPPFEYIQPLLPLSLLGLSVIKELVSPASFVLQALCALLYIASASTPIVLLQTFSPPSRFNLSPQQTQSCLQSLLDLSSFLSLSSPPSQAVSLPHNSSRISSLPSSIPSTESPSSRMRLHNS